MHHWDDMANLTQLQNEDGTNDTSDAAKTTLPYSEIVVDISSLESFTLIDEHGNLNRQFSDYDKMKSAASSNRIVPVLISMI